MNTKFTEEERADLKAQARFVRAYYYWLLLRRYGPVPLLPDEGLDYTSSYDDLAVQRNSYDECVEYIETEMRLAAQDLPLTRAVNQISRPTRGAALAARARALLYAASPINNPRPEDTDKFSDW
ncbi:SusD family [Bacteroides ovatus]|nr:SusD family [Bacteroides ovatus]